jgi:glycosyltransferase involved in cell wall biosynthesis
MHVLIATPRFAPELGGVETYAEVIAHGLVGTYGDRVTVVTSADVGDVTRSHEQHVDVIRLPRWRTASNTPLHPAWVRQFRALIRELRPDVINGHSPVPVFADAAFLARGDVRYVLTYHSGSMRKGSAGWTDRLIGGYERHLLPRMARRADAVISVFPQYLEALLGPGTPVHFVPPGVDLERFRPDLASGGRHVVGDGEVDSPPTLLFVGRLEETSRWKGVDVLLQAFRVLRPDHPTARLRLVGDGDDVARLRRYAAELGIDDHVDFAGALRGPDLVRAYQEATVLVLPSLTAAESFGIVLIEAMACGLPVVASDVGGIPNVVQDGVTGLLCEAANPNALAATTNRMLGEPELRRSLAAAARERVRERFTTAQLVSATRAVLAAS